MFHLVRVFAMSLLNIIYRIRLQRAGPFVDGIREVQRLAPNGGRFEVDQNVMDAVERMHRTPFDELLKLLDYAKLPIPTSWFEWRQPGGRGYIGYLCEDLPDGGFAFRQYLGFSRIQERDGLSVICNFGRIRVEATGWTAEDNAHRIDGAGPGQNHLQQAAGDILRLLLILNSPSRILETGEGEDNRRVDARRAREGRPPLPNLRPIRFDIGRFRRAGFDNAAPPENQRDVAAHFVRGHFKVRSTGLFWWSPHVRYQLDEELPVMPRDYKVGLLEDGR